jgi:hypothetical protein
MILTTHAIIGAAAGRLTGNPWLAFVIGFASHFVADAVPHSQYHLASLVHLDGPMEDNMVLNKKFIGDLLLTGMDFTAGIILTLFFFHGAGGITAISTPALAGALGGVLPDVLQFAYFKIRREPLVALQKFHLWIHANKELPVFPYGLVSQAAIAAFAILISKLILK